jgi:hypothetical protein
MELLTRENLGTVADIITLVVAAIAPLAYLYNR